MLLAYVRVAAVTLRGKIRVWRGIFSVLVSRHARRRTRALPSSDGALAYLGRMCALHGNRRGLSSYQPLTRPHESRVWTCVHIHPPISPIRVPSLTRLTSHDATGRFDNINNSQHTHQPSLSDPTITISRARRVLGSAPQTVPTFRCALGAWAWPW